MLPWPVVLSCILVLVSWCGADLLSFPPGFKFGAATAAYQVEGGWNASDKGESVWDHLVHTNPAAVQNFDNGDVACDSYHNWRRDVEMAVELGLHFYRFSISWPRLLPTGFTNHISEDGMNYYNNLIDELLKNGIEPAVTMHHFDLPQRLQDLGGWTNPLVSDWFADYADIVFSLYGDRVKTWFTINEPLVVCDLTYNLGTFAPPILDPKKGAFLCTKNLLLAHAKAWRIYDEKYKPMYHGKVSIVNELVWFEPLSPEDEEVTDVAREYMLGLYNHPIYSKEGGWPPNFARVIAENSIREGYPRSRLPEFTVEEIELVRGTYDFMAVNYYTTRLIRKANPGDIIEPWPFMGSPELNVAYEIDPSWGMSASSFFRVNPDGLRRLLVWLKNKYGNLEFMISENGYAGGKYGLVDEGRVDYHRRHLEQVLIAIKQDDVNVTGYTAWSIMDNFEWSAGYDTKFGLYQVDFNDPLRRRSPRMSAYFYAGVIFKHSLDVSDNYILMSILLNNYRHKGLVRR